MNANMRGMAMAAGLVAMGALAPPAWAQATAVAGAARASVDELDTVVVRTGTRLSGLKAEDSPAPVQVLDGSALQRTGQADVVQSLTQILPSFTSDAKGGDAAALTTAARLRGLSPNHTLVLVNGKRRHGTSNLNVSASAFQGGAAADLGLIPAAAIERIEVLQDGAAAQYGSDAIAGVVNIILKKSAQGGSASATLGGYGEGDGRTGILSANLGLEPVEGAFVNLTIEAKDRQHSDRSDLDARFVAPYLKSGDAAVTQVPGYPYVNHTFGDPVIRQHVVTANAGIALPGGAELYGVLTYADKFAAAIQNYRGPSTAPGFYPLGFSPVETHAEDDHAATIGIKGEAFGDWRYDLATSYGRDRAIVGNVDSMNVQLWKDTGTSPTHFYEGYLEASQSTTNLDVNRDIDVGWATPLNLALGAEYRQDTYAIGEGDAASTYRGGAAAFPGYTAIDAGRHRRNSRAFYVDLAGSPIERLQLDAAVRTEHYSDAGGATVGKLTGRYEVTPALAVRGTLSSGFRAPTLAERYYSATSISPTTASVILPSSSAAARLLGVDELKPEKSTNLSLGLVARPAARVTASLDVYRIEIKDRILQSGTLYGVLDKALKSPIVNDAIAANGSVVPAGIGSAGVSVYSNAANTRNTGLDLVLTYTDSYEGWGSVDWTAAFNYNKVKVTDQAPTPGVLAGLQLLDRSARSYLEDASPRFRLNLGALWKLGDWTVNLRENIFGPSSYLASIDSVTYYKNRIDTKFITDLDVNYRFSKAWSLSLGANNLFDIYPDRLNGAYREALNKAGRQNVAVYPSFSPTGINGGFYYARLNATF